VHHELPLPAEVPRDERHFRIDGRGVEHQHLHRLFVPLEADGILGAIKSLINDESVCPSPRCPTTKSAATCPKSRAKKACNAAASICNSMLSPGIIPA
jgi:hypothetical protein